MRRTISAKQSALNIPVILFEDDYENDFTLIETSPNMLGRLRTVWVSFCLDLKKNYYAALGSGVSERLNQQLPVTFALLSVAEELQTSLALAEAYDGYRKVPRRSKIYLEKALARLLLALAKVALHGQAKYAAYVPETLFISHNRHLISKMGVRYSARKEAKRIATRLLNPQGYLEPSANIILGFLLGTCLAENVKLKDLTILALAYLEKELKKEPSLRRI